MSSRFPIYHAQLQSLARIVKKIMQQVKHLLFAEALIRLHFVVHMQLVISNLVLVESVSHGTLSSTSLLKYQSKLTSCSILKSNKVRFSRDKGS